MAFILYCKCFLNNFPEKLIEACFSSIQSNPTSHIHKMCKVFGKPIREQDVNNLCKSWGAYLVFATSEPCVSFPCFYLFLCRAIICWTIASFVAFFTPLIFSCLQTVQRSLNFNVLISLPWISFSSSPSIVSSLQSRFSNSLLGSILLLTYCSTHKIHLLSLLAPNSPSTM